MIDQDSMENGNEAAVTEVPERTGSPGAFLREQRELKNLSLEQVADELHLTMHYVRALEADAYDKLPGAVFVKGYLRSYARLLALDPETILAQFESTHNDKVNRDDAVRRKCAVKRRRDRNRPWIIFSGVAFVVLAVVLWYISSANSSTTQPMAGNARASLPESLAESTPRQEVPEVTASMQAPEPVAPAPVVEELVEEQPVGEQLAAQDTPETAEPAVVQAVGQDRLIKVEGPGSDRLLIRFSGESWVEIEDGNEVNLYRDIRTEGDTLEISGQAPFNLLLGNASTASVSFNGREIDISDRIRIDNSARISLGM